MFYVALDLCRAENPPLQMTQRNKHRVSTSCRDNKLEKKRNHYRLSSSTVRPDRETLRHLELTAEMRPTLSQLTKHCGGALRAKPDLHQGSEFML